MRELEEQDMNGQEIQKGAKDIFLASLPSVTKWLVFQILAGFVPISAIAAFYVVEHGLSQLNLSAILNSGELFIACSIAGIAAIGNALPTKLGNDRQYEIGKTYEILFVAVEMLSIGICAIFCVISAIFYSIIRSHELFLVSKKIMTVAANDFGNISFGLYTIVGMLGGLLVVLREARR